MTLYPQGIGVKFYKNTPDIYKLTPNRLVIYCFVFYYLR